MQLARLRNAREEREASEAPARELARLQRELRDEQALDAAIEQYGRVGEHIATVSTPRGLVIVRRASAQKFRRFQDKTDVNGDDVLQLVRPCVVYPPVGELDAMLDELPAVLQTIAQAVIYLAGQQRDSLAKK